MTGLEEVKISFILNDESVSVEVDPRKRLLDMLREDFLLTGVKEGCSVGECGACTVLIDGRAVTSCLVLAPQVNGHRVTTIEGLQKNGELHPLQQAFIDSGAVQCGFCTPGMILAAKALLDRNPHPTREDIKTAISGNLCRCTGYEKIIKAVETAVKYLEGKDENNRTNDRKKTETLKKLTEEAISDDIRVIGKSIIRKDALKKTTGEALFAGDMRFENMLYGKVLRSQVPHAILKNIDTTDAKSLPGVKAVLTYKDIPGANRVGIILKDEPVLVDHKIARIGDPIALVAAETQEIAEEALERIKVELEELPPVVDVKEAIKEDSVKVHGDTNIIAIKNLIKGDVEEGFRKSDIIVENHYKTNFVSHMFIEPECGIGSYENGVITVWCSSQNVHFDRAEVARVLNMPRSKVRVIQAETGGGFGGKLDISTQCYAALLAYYTKRPVKIIYSRVESTMASSKRHPAIIRCKTGATKEGKLMALDADMILDTGAYASYGPGVITRTVVHITGPYDIPNVKVKGHLVYTNNPMAGAMRGFGVPQAAIVHESQMDILAKELGISPYEIRKRNVLKPGSYTATNQLLTSSVGIEKTLDAAVEKAKEMLKGWEGIL
ncbi:molybdopterin cofactor-binding domain-containing protein [Tepidanaerobacter sp. EBM-38]|uniref:molybdopterin cofactor-binding domain-containing protein n=1 Tax=Tepidanaerobacter sp. EBM-38 TaxID=1918496 RepID=UPI00345366B0